MTIDQNQLALTTENMAKSSLPAWKAPELVELSILSDTLGSSVNGPGDNPTTHSLPVS